MSERVFFWCRSCRQPLYATSSSTTGTDRDWEIDHQQPGVCRNGHLMPLTGTAPAPEALPDAPHILRLFGG
ncbi:hypothetical protein [Streptomyces erythrochromogenes]|uniref:hypothetical protein n=1 Tax=Streptomyces erythrochromogenes TaxID=285574 RepID=UPI00386E46CD|nr:hypothetical protein OG489_37720 [Streptomyces erythrochromogenes]